MSEAKFSFTSQQRILFDSPLSPCAQKVQMTLLEKGLSWESRPMNLPAKENLLPSYLKLNPKGVVPTLIDKGVALVESSLINEYLDDTYPEPALKPKNTIDRHRMRLWTKQVDEQLHPANGAVAWPLLVLPLWRAKKTPAEIDQMIDRIEEPARRDRQRRLVTQGFDAPDVKAGLKVYDKTLQMMEAALEKNGPWLAGSEFSLADICLLPYMGVLVQFDMTEMFEHSHPAVTEWFARCRERDSYKKVIIETMNDKVRTNLLRIGQEAWPKYKAILYS